MRTLGIRNKALAVCCDFSALSRACPRGIQPSDIDGCFDNYGRDFLYIETNQTGKRITRAQARNRHAQLILNYKGNQAHHAYLHLHIPADAPKEDKYCDQFYWGFFNENGELKAWSKPIVNRMHGDNLLHAHWVEMWWDLVKGRSKRFLYLNYRKDVVDFLDAPFCM